MADVEHSALTGASLHESKGVAAAAANRVYVSDGAGSGSWTTIGLSTLASAAKAFEAQLLHVRDVKASGTVGDAITSGSYAARTLNTTSTNEIGASLASNTITLAAGTYLALGFFHTVNSAGSGRSVKMRIRNTTDGSDIFVGHSSGNIASSEQFTATVGGKFVLAASKDIEFQMRSSGSGVVGGTAVSFGDSEVYADVYIWKVA